VGPKSHFQQDFPFDIPKFEVIVERHPTLLDRRRSLLLVIDMQEPFLNVMHGRDALLANVNLLCQAAVTLQIPIVTTTQNAPRLGPVIPAISSLIPAPAIDKMTFSCAGSEQFEQTLTQLSRKQIVICGLETHICVSQTAHDLLHAGYQVHVVPDAVSARSVERHKLGMERIRDAGILPCAAEAVVYEWLGQAGTLEFKAILPLIK